jgi:hypothetical protein
MEFDDQDTPDAGEGRGAVIIIAGVEICDREGG